MFNLVHGALILRTAVGLTSTAAALAYLAMGNADTSPNTPSPEPDPLKSDPDKLPDGRASARAGGARGRTTGTVTPGVTARVSSLPGLPLLGPLRRPSVPKVVTVGLLLDA